MLASGSTDGPMPPMQSMPRKFGAKIKRPASAGPQQQRKCRFLIDSLLEERQKKLAEAAAKTKNFEEKLAVDQGQCPQSSMEMAATLKMEAEWANGNEGQMDGGEELAKEENGLEGEEIGEMDGIEEETSEEALPSPCPVDRQEFGANAEKTVGMGPAGPSGDGSENGGNGEREMEEMMDKEDKRTLLEALVKLLPAMKAQQHSVNANHPNPLQFSTPQIGQMAANQPKEEQRQQMAMAAATAAAASMEFLQRVRLFQQHLSTNPNANGATNIAKDGQQCPPSSSSSSTANPLSSQFQQFPAQNSLLLPTPNLGQNDHRIEESNAATFSGNPPKNSPIAPQQTSMAAAATAAALCWQHFLAANSAGQNNPLGGAGAQFGGALAGQQQRKNTVELVAGGRAVNGGGKRGTTTMGEAMNFGGTAHLLNARNGANGAAAMLASIGAFRAAAAAAAAAMNGQSHAGAQQNQQIPQKCQTMGNGGSNNNKGPSTKRARLNLKAKLLSHSGGATRQLANGTSAERGSRSSNVKKYRCDICEKTFSRSNTLITHKRIHTGEKPFRCDHCGRAFRQPGNLTRHAYTHTTVKPFVCSECGKAFNRASNLQTHIRVHCLNVGDGANEGAAVLGAHFCNKCRRHFGTRAELRAHKCS